MKDIKKEVSMYELGRLLYHDWKVVNDDTHKLIRKISKLDINIEELKKGFFEERVKFIQDDESEECFYGAMDEIGINHWEE